MPCAAECRYAAGLFDGEGSINIVRGGQLSARIQMCDVGPLERLREHFGGSFYKITDPRPTRKPIGHLAFLGKKALIFMALIHPYMQNARQRSRAEWILKNWDNYASVKMATTSKIPPRWKIEEDYRKFKDKWRG